MKDLHINIGGPRDQAHQELSFKVYQAGDAPAFDSEQIAGLIAQLRAALTQSDVAPEAARRAQRHLNTIEEESRSQKPVLSEIKDSISVLGSFVQTARGLAPLFSSTLQLLATAIGMPLCRVSNL